MLLEVSPSAFRCSACGCVEIKTGTPRSNRKFCSRRCKVAGQILRERKNRATNPTWREHHNATYMRWWHRNKKKLFSQRRARRKANTQARITHRLRGRFYELIRKQRARKSNSALRLLGCSIQFFQGHIAAQFTSGMCWENWGTLWELDHIQPCASFDLTDERQQAICFNWTNFRPLQKWRNRAKAAKLKDPQLNLLLQP